MGAQPQFGEMISLVIPMQPEHQHETEKRIGGGEARVHYKSDSATENCLIILLIKCEPEKNSFPSPRARLG